MSKVWPAPNWPAKTRSRTTPSSRLAKEETPIIKAAEVMVLDWPLISVLSIFGFDLETKQVKKIIIVLAIFS